MKDRTGILMLGLGALTLALSGCGRAGVVLPAGALPGPQAIAGWLPRGHAEVYDRESLFELVDGQADAFFAYGFQQVAVQDYEDDAGAVLSVEIWQMAGPEDAYGLLTASAAGQAIDIGSGGDTDPGRRIIFWQDRYFVHVRSRQPLDDAVLQGFARTVAETLPQGGEPPPLIDRLPTDGLVEDSAVFFHVEISIQNQLWLGGENLLGLSPETDAVLARYEVTGRVAQLLLVQYAGPEAASAGLAALQGGQVDGVVAAVARDDLLGAVFGPIDETAANALLAEALGLPHN